jgi:hypothetical protein
MMQLFVAKRNGLIESLINVASETCSKIKTLDVAPQSRIAYIFKPHI